MVDRLFADPAGAHASGSGDIDRFRQSEPRCTLTRLLWRADLSAGLPRKLDNHGVECVTGDLGRVANFLTHNYPQFIEVTSGRPNATHQTVKRHYLNMCDLLEIRSAQRTIGVFVGAPEDWSTYYVRIFAIASDCQGRRTWLMRFVRECLFEPLTALGVQRIQADTSPANRAMTRLFGDLQFYATGNQLSERWGPLVQYTKFLDPACEALFLRRLGGK